MQFFHPRTNVEIPSC